MDISLLQALLLGIIEGLTEFLPISSTGHLILASELFGFTDDKAKLFAIVIQVGAILAICWEYRQKLLATLYSILYQRNAQKFVINLFIAFLPLAALGLFFGHILKTALFKPTPVALAFIIGALVIIWAEKRQHTIRIDNIDDLNWPDALKLGFAQAFALIPGTSRSGATIVGGLLIGLSRKSATEFSFFLAIPTLITACIYDLYKHRDLLQADDDLLYFATGLLAAFFSALLAVKGLLRYISQHNFIVFAWYRIAFGLIVLGTDYSGLVEWSAR